MATYALSDIHGCYDELVNTLEKISFSKDDELYVVGDLFDRGPQNAEVLKWFISAGDNVHLLRGNHDDFLVSETNMDYERLEISVSAGHWVRNHYGETAKELLCKTTASERKAAIEKIASCGYYEHLCVNGNEFILVHAGINPNPLQTASVLTAKQLMECQNNYDMTWIRDEWINYRGLLPCRVVFGHTKADSIRRKYLHDKSGIQHSELEKRWSIFTWGQKIAIDCGVSAGGRLGVLRLEDLAEFYSDFNMDAIRAYHHASDGSSLFDWEPIFKSSSLRAMTYAAYSFEVLDMYKDYIDEVATDYDAMVRWILQNPDNPLFAFIEDQIEQSTDEEREYAFGTAGQLLSTETLAAYLDDGYSNVAARVYAVMPNVLREALLERVRPFLHTAP